MSRWNRNGQGWHFVWSGIQCDADAQTLALASETEDWGYERLQMVGIGTSNANLDKFRHTFCSLLGKDEDSWGLSYTGLLHHKGDKINFSLCFGQGSIIGFHLDTWHSTPTFFKNRKCIGVNRLAGGDVRPGRTHSTEDET